MASINDVAKKAGVSKATVSRVLNGLTVRPTNRDRVQRAIKNLNYQPNAQARGLSSGKTRLIGVTIPGAGNSFYGYIIEGISLALRASGYNMILCSIQEQQVRELAAAQLLRESRADGIIFVTPREVTDKYLRESMQGRFPFVLVDAGLDFQGVSTVAVDNVSGGHKATTHLIELGHRDIGLILGYREATETAERLAGYKRSLSEAGIDFRPDLVVYGEYTLEGGCVGAERLLTLETRPSAIFAADDYMAFGAMRASRELGIRIPQDLALVGYDDIEAASLSSPRLTTVRQPLLEMGKIGAQKLLRMISGEETEPTRIVLPVELVVRESCGASLR